MSWRITPTQLLVDDQDALTYLAAVETADGQALESGVRLAVNAFVKGCKADGIWPAIKASCILAGARTLAGALVPLVGAAPTNVGGLFVSGDYNRETGLVGNGSTKYLNSNRNNNADPQDSRHFAAYATTVPSGCLIGSGLSNGSSFVFAFDGQFAYRVSSGTSISTSFGGVPSQTPVANSLVAAGRSNSTQVFYRRVGSTSTASNTSSSPASENMTVFARGGSDRFSDTRIAFYSIGESLDLALLDARVTTLVNALSAAIP